MAAVHGDAELPAVAGALAQLVQLDLAAAEMALLTVLSQPNMARAMGAAAARRARDLFAPEVVMAAHEELFVELEQCCRKAPADAHSARPVSPQLDPVRVFERFASHHFTAIPGIDASLQTLPESVRQQRAPFGKFWSNPCRLPSAVVWRATWFANIIRKHVLMR